MDTGGLAHHTNRATSKLNLSHLLLDHLAFCSQSGSLNVLIRY